LADKRVYEFGKFRLDTAERVIETDGRPLPLTPKAYEVLLVLVENRGRIVEKEDLMRRVWPDTFVEDSNLGFNISVLRKLLGEGNGNGSSRYIETVPKRGYRFVAEVVEVPEKELPGTEAAGRNGHNTTYAVRTPPPDAQLKLPGRFSRRWKVMAAVAVLLVLAAVGVFVYWYQHRAPRLTNRDTIVVADFVNKTGDPVFDETLDQGLAVQLEQSPFLSLISDARIRQTLRMMGQPPDTRLTAEVAREVCERTGSSAVVEGSIASLGSQYVLGLSTKNCRTGDVLDKQQVQAARKEDVLNALSEMARRFRSRVGESLTTIERYDTPLAEATTPSLDALKAYSAGWKTVRSGGATAALPLFKSAVEIDPNFAMAYEFLGRMYADLDESELSAENTTKAWQLREHTSDRERFWITASYELLVTGNLEKAQETGELWVRTYPRDAAAHGMLSGYINKGRGRYEEALAEARKANELDPDFAIMHYNIAVNQAYLNRLAESEETLRRAEARGLEIDEFLMLDYDLAFLRGDEAGTEREAARARRRSGAENWVSNREAFALAYTGHIREAIRRTQHAVEQAQQAEQRERAGLWEAGAAVRQALFGYVSEARERAKAALALSRNSEVEYGAALALAFSGDDSQAQALADDLEKRFPEDTTVRFNYLPVLRARIAMNGGKFQEAVSFLDAASQFEFGLPRSGVSGSFGALYPIYLRGEAYLALRKGEQAAAEFRKVLDHRGIVVSDPIGALVHLQLARAFASSGERSKAASAYADFLNLWKDADGDIPILNQARSEYAKLE